MKHDECDDLQKARAKKFRSKILVLFLTHKRLLDGIGGIESMGKLLLYKLVDYGIPVSLISKDFLPKITFLRSTNNNDQRSEKLLSRDLAFSLYTFKEIIISSLLVLPTINAIKLARKRGFVPVILSFDSFGGLTGLLSSKITGTPFAVQAHGLYIRFIDVSTKNQITRRILLNIERAVMRNATMILSVNDETLEYFKRYYNVTKTKCRLLPTPTDVKQFAPISELRNYVRKELGIAAGANVIGFVGRLSYEKNVEFLLRAFKKAIETSSIPVNSILLVVGDGPLRTRLTHLSVELSISAQVVFTGFRRDVHRLMNSMDMLVLPSQAEGIPCVALEAMACGVPVILSDILCHKELLRKAKCGLIFKAECLEDLVKCLSIISNDYNLRKKMSSDGRAYVENNHSLDHVFKRYFQAIKDCAKIQHSR
ncbi:MAG: glycosyltransferase family 4 protein [Candidatus Heimdallarchaeaceae archaeon]